MSLSVDAQAREHAHLRRPLTSADPAVQHELAAADSSSWVGCCKLNEASRKIFDCSCSRRWLKAHDRHKIGAAIRRHRAKDTHECVRAGLKRNGFAVREVDKDFETLGRRNPELDHRDWR